MSNKNIDRIPFTYLIGWSDIGLYYYGAHYSKGCKPEDLWTKYFTGSKTVKEIREQWGEPNVVQIRKVFDSIEDTRKWENKVLKRCKVLLRQDIWLNKTDNQFILPECCAKGKQKAATTNRTNGSGIFSISHEERVEIGKRCATEKLGFHKLTNEERFAYRSRGGKNSTKTNMKPVMIKGVIYDSLIAAEKATGINYSTIAYRCNTPKFTDYHFC